MSARGGLVVDDDLATGWEPELVRGQRVDLRFPTTEVRTVEVLVFSGPPAARALAGHRRRGHRWRRRRRHRPPALPRSRRCVQPEVPGRRLSRDARRPRAPHIRDQLSVTLTGIEPAVGRFGQFPPRVVEVRINGRDWSELARSERQGELRPPLRRRRASGQCPAPAEPRRRARRQAARAPGVRADSVGPRQASHRNPARPFRRGAYGQLGAARRQARSLTSSRRSREGAAGRSLPDPPRPAG